MGLTHQPRTTTSVFVPEFSASTTPPVYELATEPDYTTLFYGDAPTGIAIDDGTTVDEWGRIVTGSAFNDAETFDPGAGYYYVPLQHAPHDSITGAIGEGQIMLIGATNVFYTITLEIQPVLDVMTGLVPAPDPGQRAERAGVMWLILHGEHDPTASPAQTVSADNPGVPGLLFTIDWHVRYAKANP